MMIIYSNLLLIGYSFFDFVNFIIMRPFMIIFIIGIILFILLLERVKKYELLLRCKTKFFR